MPSPGAIVSGGSSPRMRGKPGGACRRRGLRGLIPAHAGKTSGQYQPSPPGRAHPRACGENNIVVGVHRVFSGSSPRMRGKPRVLRSPLLRQGLIPAHAGKTRSINRLSANRRAHPRACGENRVKALRRPGVYGSSPRMRGKQAPSLRRRLPRRLIPAHAGKTHGFAGACPVGGAHPRACGENGINLSANRRAKGSSPRMRGKPNHPSSFRATTGLIPAHAGKTGMMWSASALLGAHPRACGEN